ncbi:MAG: HEAT repeat domain-containing protein, partial [Candidatus Poribacteria bacterium]|nr:HEAT repeat domain-containing protein [Candidatus Poribacteria bacterium]
MDKHILIILLNTSWQWGLIVGIAWMLARRFRGAYPTGHALWLTTLVAIPLLLVLNGIVPGISFRHGPAVRTVRDFQPARPIQIDNRPSSIDERPATNSQRSSSVESWLSISQTESSIVNRQKPALERSEGSIGNSAWRWTHGLLLVWGVGVLWFVIRFVHGVRRLGQLHRCAHLADGTQQQMLEDLCSRLTVTHPVQLRVSAEVDTPISFGWRHPCIILPVDVSTDPLELILLHELAHLQRRDWLVNLLVQFIGMPFFFHPLFYFVRRCLADVREQICDDWVIQATGRRSDYAQCLVDMLSRDVRQTQLALALGPRRSHLMDRVKAILDNSRPLTPFLSRKAALLIGGFALVLLPLVSIAQIMPLRTLHLVFTASETPAAQSDTPQGPVATDKDTSFEESRRLSDWEEVLRDGALIKALLDAPEEIRRQWTLSDESLIKAMFDAEDYWEARRRVTLALGLAEDGKTIASLMETLGSADVRARRYAAIGLWLVSNENAVSPLSKALRDSDEQVRRYAALALGRTEAEAAVPALVETLRDESEKVRGYAAYALGRIEDETAVSALIVALKDESAAVRVEVADALGDIGELTQDIIPALIEALNDEAAGVRAEAADGLGDIDGPAQDIVPALIKALRDTSAMVRAEVADALADIGEPARAAVPALIEALRDESEEVRLEIVDALEEMGEAAIPALIKALSDESEEIRMEAADALGDIGAPTEAVLAALIEALGDESEEVRDEVIDALEDMGKPAVPALIKALSDESVEIRIKAADALGDMDAPTEAALAALIEALGDESEEVRDEVIDALEDMGKPAVPALI